jgi:hypothetical protein
MPKETISQNLLKRIVETRAQIKALEKTLEADEASVFAALKNEQPVATGVFAAEIKINAGRRSTAWKEKAIELCDEIRGAGEGALWAARVIAATKPGEPSEKLIVEYRGKAAA